MKSGTFLRDTGTGKTATGSAERRSRCLFLLTAVLAVGAPGSLLAGCGGAVSAVGGAPSAGAAGPVSAKAAGPAGSAGTAAVRRRSSPLAENLIDKAAQAVVLRSYQGQEMLSSWDAGGGSVVMADVWHVSGGTTIIQTQASGTDVSSQPFVTADPDNESPEGVLGVTVPLVGLLKQNYIVAYGGTASADNRPARVIEAWRPDGSLAARFWLDIATGLPLEREVFDPAAHVISEGVFVNVKIGSTAAIANAPAVSSSAQAAQKAAALPVPASPVLTPGKLLAQRGAGWPVPQVLPGGLSLFTGYVIPTSTGPVLDLCYSDGLFVVSLFEQRGKLAPPLAGWQRAMVGGRPVYATLPSQRLLAWTGQGVVYTVAADAPAQTVAAVVKVLPHDAPPGFWKRIARGMVRLARVLDPFG